MSLTASVSFSEVENDDESIIKRKLIYDSSMEESYINLLQKLIVKWIVTGDQKSVKDSEAIYSSITHQLFRVNMFRKKSKIARKRNLQDIAFLKLVQGAMKAQVISVTNTLKSTRELLKAAQKESAKSDQLETLLQDVLKYPPVQHLRLRKKNLVEQQSKVIETSNRIISLEHQLQDQTQNWLNSYKSCTEETEEM